MRNKRDDTSRTKRYVMEETSICERIDYLMILNFLWSGESSNNFQVWDFIDFSQSPCSFQTTVNWPNLTSRLCKGYIAAYSENHCHFSCSPFMFTLAHYASSDIKTHADTYLQISFMATDIQNISDFRWNLQSFVFSRTGLCQSPSLITSGSKTCGLITPNHI